jgi:catechol 2,3-dioxygenase
MASLPLDVPGFIYANEAEGGQGSLRVGHVHLKVGDIAQAEKFYVDLLGFEAMATMSSALFVATGGYHHHLGLNVWQSRGAGERSTSLGLGQVVLRVSNPDLLHDIAAKATQIGAVVAQQSEDLILHDFWGTRLALRAQ